MTLKKYCFLLKAGARVYIYIYFYIFWIKKHGHISFQIMIALFSKINPETKFNDCQHMSNFFFIFFFIFSSTLLLSPPLRVFSLIDLLPLIGSRSTKQPNERKHTFLPQCDILILIFRTIVIAI